MATTQKQKGASLNTRAGEVFRGMWASLFYSQRAAGRTVVIASPTSREGATTIACGLAVSGGGPGGSAAKTALVDFNLRRPRVHTVFRIPHAPGVAEVLLDGMSLQEAAREISPGLDVFPVGNVSQRSLSMLNEEHLDNFFQAMAESYDYVLVDTASVNHYPEAQVLAGVVKDVVLTVFSGRTPREAVAQAKRRIEHSGGRVAGVVLNMRTFPIPDFLYRRV